MKNQREENEVEIECKAPPGRVRIIKESIFQSVGYSLYRDCYSFRGAKEVIKDNTEESVFFTFWDDKGSLIS